jgi:RNA polymerase sigma-70 factor (ECF subfamily)
MDNIISINPEKAAFHNQLLQDYYGMVFSWLKKSLEGDAEQAADITQEVFYEAWLSANKLRYHPRVGGWLMTTAQNKLRHFKRSLSHQHDLLNRLEGVTDGSRPAEEVFEVLDCLTPPERRLIQMHYLEGLRLSEAAKALGIHTFAAKKRLSRIRIKLRQILKD